MKSAVVGSHLSLSLFVVGITFFALVFEVAAHGRLFWPPARATIWRHPQFDNLSPAIHYTDNELNCGGFKVQHEVNDGRCGECGDAYNITRPRPNEGGGYYARGIIVDNYIAGQEIDVHVILTANHLGYFEFRLCPHNNPLVPVDQSCLDENLLEIVESTNGVLTKKTREPVLEDLNDYQLKLKLPDGLSCTQCVLQWHYLTGNSWGECEDGSGALGCGPVQETFRACADVAIN